MKLSDDTKFILLMTVVIASIVMMFFQPDYKEVNVTYDCQVAEISPDIPPRVKEECRKQHPAKWLKAQGSN